MTIYYVHFHFVSGDHAGNGRSFEFTERWKSLGAKVDMVSAHKFGISYAHSMPLWRRSFAFLQFFLRAFFHLLKAKKTDKLYASSTPLSVGVLALMMKKIKGMSYVFETVDLWPDVPIQLSKLHWQLGVLRFRSVRTLLYWIERKIYWNAAHIVCLSEGMKEKIVGKGIPESKITVNHNGTNTSLFQPNRNNEQLKTTLGFLDSDFIVLYAGTIGVANGCEAIIEAAVHIQKMKLSDIKFVVVGNGNRLDYLKEKAKSLHVESIYFVDKLPQKEVVKYFEIADIGLVTFAPFSILETNSANKFFDYLAVGLPVCINYEGWQKDYLQSYQCGFSSPMNNSKRFAEYIHTLYQDANLRQVMGKNARELAMNKFDRNLLAMQVYDLLTKTS